MTNPVDSSSKAWGGRFDADRNQAFDRLNASIGFDWRLVAHDLWQNRVYAAELNRIAVLKDEELALLQPAFETVEQEIRDGRFPWRYADEDVHMNLERRLTELAGDAAKRIHTGRSRNDQVATVFRLWLRDAMDLIQQRLATLIETTLDQAERYKDIAMPGFTHLQRAQVVTFGHQLHAYAEMLLRDSERLADARGRLNRSPLGSGALASSPYPLDRQRLAEELGFNSYCNNSMDAVSDRDFALESLSAIAVTGIHLSRWAEDLTLWMSAEFGWVRLPDAFCTGSSIMPQKKNPDLAELVRGKAGRLTAALSGLMMVVKGLPLCYNKDLQEDKEPLFDSVATIHDILVTWQAMVAEMEPRRDRIEAALSGGHLLATDLADYLVREKNIPFRDAHHMVGRAVRLAEDESKDISDLTAEELASISPDLDRGAADVLTIAGSLASRSLPGGPVPTVVSQNIARSRDALARIEFSEPVLMWAFDLPQPQFS